MLIKKNKAEFFNCNLAGFGHADGFLVLKEMRPGDKLLMLREEDNPHDHDAIALFYVPKGEFPKGATKHNVDKFKHALHVGYIPASENSQLSTFLDMGYIDAFECIITNINRDAHPNCQVQLRVNLLKKESHAHE